MRTIQEIDLEIKIAEAKLANIERLERQLFELKVLRASLPIYIPVIVSYPVSNPLF